MNLLAVIGLLVVLVVLVWLLLRPPPRRLNIRPGLPYGEMLAARERANELLASVIGRETVRSLAVSGYLDVPSPNHPNRIYRIPAVRGQVEVIEDGQTIMKLCVVPSVPLPEGDLVLMHKLFIEADEEYYLDVANRYGPVPYRFYR